MIKEGKAIRFWLVAKAGLVRLKLQKCLYATLPIWVDVEPLKDGPMNNKF